MSAYYSAVKAKRSLLHFLVGKVGSALLGICALLLAIRLLPQHDFGLYVAVIAFCEIFYLLSGLGLSTMAQRYVTEYRLKLTPKAFPSYIWRLQAFRFFYSIAFLIPVFLFAQWIFGWFYMAELTSSIYIIVLVLILGSQVRYLDEIMASLLMQGALQISVVLRNFVKLLGYFLLSLSFGVMAIKDVLWIEVALYFVALLTSLFVLWRYLKLSSSAELTLGQSENYHNPDANVVARRFYLVQCTGQIYGSNIMILLTTRLLGSVNTAVLGFAQSLTEMVRNYLPAQLLLGWIRPLMISRYVESGDYRQLQSMANMILKINLLALMPMAVMMFVHGNAIAAWVSGGRYPEVGHLLVILLLLIMLQTAHLVLSLTTLTIEKANANVYATFAACLGLPLIFLFAPLWGVHGVVIALCISELIWCATVLFFLANNKMSFTIDWLSIVKLMAAAAILLAFDFIVSPYFYAVWQHLLMCVLGFLFFLLICAFLKPFNDDERNILARIIPVKLLLW